MAITNVVRSCIYAFSSMAFACCAKDRHIIAFGECVAKVWPFFCFFFDKNTIISSDNGAEMQGQVSAYLERMGIVPRFKAVGDRNAIGVVDNTTQSINQITARMMAEEGTSSWAAVLPRATAAYNKNTERAIARRRP